ncbi:hypothetical protein [Lysinibacillus sp. NPDC093692]|uniref:hypothetical protein n=1 Tax=Lysinibacillus sp. NPDC093692 TaxID=3390578 RepID=UPI003D069253
MYVTRINSPVGGECTLFIFLDNSKRKDPGAHKIMSTWAFCDYSAYGLNFLRSDSSSFFSSSMLFKTILGGFNCPNRAFDISNSLAASDPDNNSSHRNSRSSSVNPNVYSEEGS